MDVSPLSSWNLGCRKDYRLGGPETPSTLTIDPESGVVIYVGESTVSRYEWGVCRKNSFSRTERRFLMPVEKVVKELVNYGIIARGDVELEGFSDSSDTGPSEDSSNSGFVLAMADNWDKYVQSVMPRFVPQSHGVMPSDTSATDGGSTPSLSDSDGWDRYARCFGYVSREATQTPVSGSSGDAVVPMIVEEATPEVQVKIEQPDEFSAPHFSPRPYSVHMDVRMEVMHQEMADANYLDAVRAWSER